MNYMIRPDLQLLDCPFRASPTTPDARRCAEEHLKCWLLEYDLVFGERDAIAYAHAITELLVRSVPDITSNDDAWLASVDLTAWICLLDDTLCDGRSPADSASFLSLLPRLLAINDGNRSASMDPFARSLLDLRGRFLRVGSARQFLRLIGHLSQFLLAMVWEVQVRSQKACPTLDGYVNLRRLTVAARPFLAALSIVWDVDLPDEDLVHPTVVELTQLCCDHMAYSNDFYSEPKETRCGVDQLNLVSVLVTRSRSTRDQAFRECADMCNVLMRRFILLVDGFAQSANPMQLRHCLLLQTVMRANLDWATACDRYGHNRNGIH